MRILAKGFTLIELVTVLVLLGVLSVGISGFIGVTTQIYVDVTTRDELIASARFSIERLNREIRGALPNSIRTLNNDRCLEFTPAPLSAVYTQLSVAPDPQTDEIKFIRFFSDGANLYNDDLEVIVYPLSPSDVYDNNDKRAAINSLDQTGNEWTLTLSANKQFPAHSPTSRLYFVQSPISYCIDADVSGENGKLYRYQNYNGYSNGVPNSTGVLMAQSLDISGSIPFRYAEATRLRNAIVLINISFAANDETISFNNEIQVPNVP
ncbi:prepilin-type N-terminal cleavage/methylation domain-containing protein [Thalassotalea sp. LPB0316]|uniref:prepilin-type N-terminal cleavage/methylation domain-containing protein n=1 Tax=Thalassotalea sp. LPB0316 TaxID=2769490 RepID=UPI001867CA59|nr:prepilin-type N-terminal cleavage/methylation domain-containing protein [Thalassotalea sp. LPB0316]QOL26754.1 prepilin-type N-terminal cleavage/methylation domain-containing protein [Thalassotalea sp. LPB0316]